MQTDVLIVGAGPTGLMLANQLARYGVRIHIIDRHAGPTRETRALGVQSRTLEIYAKLGVVDEALRLGTAGTGANMWSEGRRMARIPLGDAGRELTRFPFIHILGQDDNEGILGNKLRESGIDVQWNTELLALEQHADHVAVTVKLADGQTRVIEAAWVAGCDGAHSAVRHLNGIDFPGAPYEHVFFVADVEMTGTMVPNEVNIYLWKRGFHLFFPMRGKNHWRLVGLVPDALLGKSDLKFEDVTPSLRHEGGSQLQFDHCTWFSTYRIHHRRAGHFRAGRCFLLGDAAHIHSPMGAQGMNTGLQDAYNLAWKLAHVVSGHAHAEILDTYEAERMPVADHLLSTTDRFFRMVVSDSRVVGLLRTKVAARIAARAMRRKSIQGMAFRTVSQIGIRYRHSPLSCTQDGLPKTAPTAGDRFPWLHLQFAGAGSPSEDLFERLDDTRFNLLVFGQTHGGEDLDDFADVLTIHTVPPYTGNQSELARAHIPATAFYLLRPDGHIGLCGTRHDAAAVRQYLEERVGLVAQNRNDRVIQLRWAKSA
jgi:2-polyprenyl-6-methoxyphenol hydroxylase-like FAD-dependent oxidoreductase